MRKLFRYFVGLLLVVSSGLNLSAGVADVGSGRSFDKRIQRNELAIVMFYKYSKKIKKSDPDLYHKIKNMMRFFKRTSKIGGYDDNVKFVRVNLSKEKLFGIGQAYRIKKLPTFLLFKDGSIYKDKSGKMARFEGFANIQELKQFIDNFFRDYIKRMIKRKREERIQRAREARYLYWNYGGYPYSGYGYGWPYHGYYRHGYGYGGFGLGLHW